MTPSATYIVLQVLYDIRQYEACSHNVLGVTYCPHVLGFVYAVSEKTREPVPTVTGGPCRASLEQGPSALPCLPFSSLSDHIGYVLVKTNLLLTQLGSDMRLRCVPELQEVRENPNTPRVLIGTPVAYLETQSGGDLVVSIY